MRLRIRYTKLGRVRFISARDLGSVWERAIRRADIPIAYSQGFTPHPKVSFPDALPVGHASTAEYAELTLTSTIDPGIGLARLSATLPTGLDITSYLVVADGSPRLAKYLRATLWELAWPALPPDEAELVARQLERRGRDLMSTASLDVVRRRPKGDRVLDVRPPLVAVATAVVPDRDPTSPTSVPLFRAILRNDGPTIRPADLVVALDSLGDQPLPTPRLFTRVAQGRTVDEGIVEALTQQVEHLDVGRHAEAA